MAEETLLDNETQVEQQDPPTKITQQALNDFSSTIKAKPNLTEKELLQKFPEFNNNKKVLQAAYDYDATSKSGKYKSEEEINSKFPEFEFTDVKKKDGGKSSSTGAFPSTSELFGSKGTSTSRLDGLPEEINPIDQVLNADRLSKQTKKETITEREQGASIGDLPKDVSREIDVPDEEAIAKSKELKDQLKSSGINVDQYQKLFGDIPKEDFNIAGFTKSELHQRMKDNPLEAERFIQGNKAIFKLQEAVKEQQLKDPTTDYTPLKNTILDAGNNNNFSQRSQDNAAIVKAMDLIPNDEERQKVKDNFAASQAYVYGQNSEDTPELQKGEYSDRLNNNQLIARKYLQDVHPEMLNGFDAALSDPTKIKGNVDAELGQQEKAKKLDEIGINLKTNYAKERLTQISPRYNELVKLSQERELTLPEKQEGAQLEQTRTKLVGMMTNAENEISNMNANYPLAARADADNFAQELLGEKNTGLSHVALTMGKATNNTYEGIVNAVKAPFLSKDNQDINQAEIIGKGAIDDNITYLSQDKQLMQTFKGKVSAGLQADIDLIKRDNLSTDEQKRQKVQDLLLSRPKEWQRTPIEGGKSNIGLVSMLYGTGDLAANLVPFIALEGITGGGATAGAIRKFTSVFASAAATSYQETLRGAIQEGVSNPYEKAFRVTAINSLAMAGAGTPAAIRKLAGLQKGIVGEQVMKMTDDEILMALRETPKEFSVIKKAYNIGAKVGTSAVDASKESVKFGGFTTAGQVANDVADGKVDTVEHYAKHAAIEALKFAAFGTAMGAATKLSQGHNETNKATIFEAANNPESFTKAVDERISNGTLSSKEGEQIKVNIIKAAEVLKKVPLVNGKGNPLSEQGSRDLLILKLQEKDIEETLSKDIPKELFTKMEERLVDIQDKMDKVYKGTFVDENTMSKRDQLIEKSKNLINRDVVKGFSSAPLKDAANTDKNKLESYLKDIAEQADDPLSYDNTVKTNGKSLVDVAQQLFPKNEKPIGEDISSQLKTADNVQEADAQAQAKKEEGGKKDVLTNAASSEGDAAINPNDVKGELPINITDNNKIKENEKANESNGQSMLEGVSKAGDKTQGGQDSEQLRKEKEVKAVEDERDNEINKVSKPDLKLTLVPSSEIVKTKDFRGNKEIHDTIKEKYKKLKALIECL